MLQNADDNEFTKAATWKEEPYISFQVHPDRIIIDCNEDGFSEADLKAIASIGESSKKERTGYIGNKGIGFKSVFIAATKVYIQSGPFSFSFKHAPGDIGLGMAIPTWEGKFADLGRPNLTRMTLHLHQAGDAVARKEARAEMEGQFRKLRETWTLLLFLRRLRLINVSEFYASGNLKCSTSFRKKRNGLYTQIEREKTGPEGTETDSRYYHVTRSVASGLPRPDSWESSDNSQSATTAEVVIAFPLTSNLQPSVEPQDVFAFLPLRSYGLRVGLDCSSLLDERGDGRR